MKSFKVNNMNKEDIYQITKIILGLAFGTYLVIRSTQVYNLLKLCLKV